MVSDYVCDVGRYTPLILALQRSQWPLVLYEKNYNTTDTGYKVDVMQKSNISIPYFVSVDSTDKSGGLHLDSTATLHTVAGS